MSAWIRMLNDDEADGDLAEALELARTPLGEVANVMRVHSLRPSSMRGHVVLYNAALHDDRNTLPGWLQETLGSYVSLLNGCVYSFTNHWANARHLIGDEDKADQIEAAMQVRRPQDAFDGSELALMGYAEALTLNPGSIEMEHVDALKRQGVSDGEILEANQIICYFNYANRVLNGLGVTLEGDTIGYYADETARPSHDANPNHI